eukprot:m.75787 g.75787  ORF g.75787 m.75787 type:complete len:638 (+) comp9019_c0_seq2:73-1986(+)
MSAASQSSAMSSSGTATAGSSLFRTYIPSILESMPSDWRGTTFNNSNLLGRETFTKILVTLLQHKQSAGHTHVGTEELSALGNAEDYLRVATNISSTLEAALASAVGLDVAQVFTFGSTTMPIVAVALTSKVPVHLYCGDQPFPFTADSLKFLRELGARIECHNGQPVPRLPGERPVVVVALSPDMVPTPAVMRKADAVVSPSVLYIANPRLIPVADVLVIRKRMATPVTTPAAETMLRALVGLPPDGITAQPLPAVEVDTFLAHLQELSGTDVNRAAQPVVFTAGLPTISSLWLTLIQQGGADILMSSTAYGGSSQLTDLIDTAATKLKKHTFDIQGSANINASIQAGLRNVLANGKHPITVVFVEIPTNPDQKIPNLDQLVQASQRYQTESGKNTLLLIDTTFAPGSKVLQKFKQVDAALPAMCFISMSKSISRGVTTAGTLVANHTPFATSLLDNVRRMATMLDTTAKHDTLLRLTQNHRGVEQRCRDAYSVAVTVGQALQKAVREQAETDMPLSWVGAEYAAVGFTSSTFSFNLPGLFSADVNAGLAQRFVDLLTADRQFKPCVSFGQDNGLVYCTVPATSTQGAIKEEDKAKQAVGGVQLVRLSFPPSLDVESACKVVQGAVANIYGNRGKL